jgi:cell shape-determining protein MreC
MIYLKRTNPAEKRGKMTTFTIVFCLALLFAIHYFFPRFIPAVLYPVTTVFWKAESGTIGWFVNMGKLVQSKYSLVKENKRLSDEVAARDASMLLLDALQKENEELKSVVGRIPKGKVILGVILSRPPMTPYDTLVIDIGTDDGVKPGDKVYTDGDTLIGDVVEAYAGQSKVSLYSTPGRVIPVIIGETQVETQATGRGGGNFIAKLPGEIGVDEGDTIIMPQIRPHAFGVVERVISETSDSLQTILFKTPVNIHEFKYVEVDTTPVE